MGETLEHIENNIRDLSVTNKGEDRTKTISDDTDDPLGLSSLNEPLDPLVEIVFVHGLGGGSRKSWSYEHRLGCFWPGKWLTSDADFRHARIFTFGYSSTNSETVLSVAGISEFAQSLLNALNDTIKIRNSGRPIVLVGHSMGGIVIKKVIVLLRLHTEACSSNVIGFHNSKRERRANLIKFQNTELIFPWHAAWRFEIC